MKSIICVVLLWFTAQLNAGFFLIASGGIPGGIDSPSLNISNTISISAWFLIQNDNTGQKESHVICSKGVANVFVKDMVYSLMEDGGRMRFDYTSPGGAVPLHTWRVTVASKMTNVLHHVGLTFTYGTPASMKVWLDGVLQTGAWVTGNGNSNATPNSQTFTLAGWSGGQVDPGVDSGVWAGCLYEIALWNSVVTDGQMQLMARAHLKNMPLGIDPTHLVGFYPWWNLPNYVAMDINQKSCADRSVRHNSFTGAGFGRAEPLSYPPNE